MKIRIMVAEDERLAREELLYLLKQEEEVELLPSATNGRELLELVEEHDPDVIFLDIHMPDIQGVQAARMLSSRKHPPLIVFSTAYENYAIDAFELDAVDYLLKPYDNNRLKETLTRIQARMVQGRESEKPSVPKLPKLLIDDGERLVLVEPQRILYAVREERMILIHTLTHVYTSKMTLQQLEEKLRPYSFYRTHRSYLVNMNAVVELVPWFNGAYNIILNDKKRTQVPVSRSAAKELLQLLQG